VQAEVGFVAGGVPAGRLFGDLEIGRQDRVFAPALRLAFGRSLDVDQADAAGGATLRWTLGAFEACPLRFALARPLAARPCIGVAAGALQAAGTGVNGAESRTRPWVALDAVGRLAFEPVAWLAIELEAGVVAPLYRESFFFEPGVTVYEAPTAAFLGRVGFAVRFP
jgi:hypothetical protein